MRNKNTLRIRKNIRRRVRNSVLKCTSCVALIMFLAAWSTINAEAFAQTLLCMLCAGWLLLFCIANDQVNRKDKEHHE